MPTLTIRRWIVFYGLQQCDIHATSPNQAAEEALLIFQHRHDQFELEAGSKIYGRPEFTNQLRVRLKK